MYLSKDTSAISCAIFGDMNERAQSNICCSFALVGSGTAKAHASAWKSSSQRDRSRAHSVSHAT